MTTIPTYDAIRAIAVRLVQEHYPTAVAAIIGGSFATGRQTPSSDIDLLLLFEHVDCAWRYDHRGRRAHGGTVRARPGHVHVFLQGNGCARRHGAAGDMVLEGENILAAGDAYARLHALAQAIDRWPGRPCSTRRTCSGAATPSPPRWKTWSTARTRARRWPWLASCMTRWPTCTCARPAQWSGGGKHLFRRLQAFDAAIAGQLDGALRLVASDLPAGQRAFEHVDRRRAGARGRALAGRIYLPAPAHWRSAPAA